MKIALIKKSNRCFIELPQEFADFESIEIFRLRDGFYLLALPLEQIKKLGMAEAETVAEGKTVTDEEKEVIMKLLSVRFEQRTPKNVAKTLSPKELEILKILEKKGFVNVFVGRKYAEGVYNVDDRIFSMLQSRKTGQSKAGTTPRRPAAPPSEAEGILGKKGYLVLSEKEALAMMGKLKEHLKRGELRGLKGFDNNYYVINSKFFAESSRKILKALDKERSIGEIMKATRMDEDAVKAVLNFLAESGEVIEKRKGVYAAV